MYASKIDEKHLNFAVSGKLWKRSLIMIDEETQTLWSQLLGRAMEGELKGRTLEIIPSSLTSWQKWKQRYPETTVIKLKRTSRAFRNDYYRDPARFVVGISKPGKSKAWPFDLLMKKPVANDQFDGVPIVVHLDKETGASHIFEATVNGKRLKFEESNGRIRDLGSGTIWDLATGKAISGKLSGERLRALPSIPSFKKSWMNFYPESEFWDGD